MNKIVQSVTFAGVLSFISLHILADDVIQPKNAKQAENVTQAKGTSYIENSYGHVENSFSMQAYTGVFNTPTAEVVDYGDFEFYYSNNYFDQGTKINKSDGFEKADDLKFAIGLLPNIEVVGRLGTRCWQQNLYEGPCNEGRSFRDLSGSVKWQIPYIPQDWFTLAVGGQDVGGSVVKSEAYYVNASKEFLLKGFGFVRTTVGVATSDNAIGYMDGVIGSIEYQPVDYLQLAADYDANAINVGVKAFTPDEWLPRGWKLSAAVQLYSSDSDHNEKNQWFSLGVTIPIGGKKDLGTNNLSAGVSSVTDPLTAVNGSKSSALQNSNPVNKVATATRAPGKNTTLSNPADRKRSLLALSARLTDAGYESVSVGVNPQGYAVVQFENNIYNRNEQDAIYDVSSLIETHLHEPAILELTNQGVVVQRQQVGLSNAAGDITDTTTLFNSQYFSKVNWLSNNESNTHLTPRLILSPALSSLVGSEFGAFDYQLLLSTNVQMSLWDGAVLDIRHMSSSIANTEDFDKGNYINKRFGIKEGVDRRLIHQTVSLPFNIFSKLSYGRIYGNADGWLSESRWASDDNTHRFTLLAGDFESVGGGGKKYYHKPTLLKYRYRYAPLNWDIELTAGDYWHGDIGFTVRSVHWFGNAQVGVQYRKTKFDSSNGGESEDFLALGFSIPLTFKKSMKATYGFQVRGTEQFNYSVETSLTEKNTGNTIKTGFGKEPLLYHNLSQTYFNRDRN
jgi:hypothetical protein